MEDIRVTVALVGAVAGAGLTAVVTFVTGWLSRRHDQRRWLLDKRLEAYLAFNEKYDAWEHAYGAEALPQDALVDLLRDLAEKVQLLHLLAPRRTVEVALRLVQRLADFTEHAGNGPAVFRPDDPMRGELASQLMVRQRLDLQGSAWGRLAYARAVSRNSSTKV